MRCSLSGIGKMFFTIVIAVTITVTAFGYSSSKADVLLDQSCSTKQDIIEINDIADVLKYTKNVDLVVSDIDATLLLFISKDETSNHKSNWLSNFFPALFDKPSRFIPSSVEQETPYVIETLRAQGIPLLLYTARSWRVRDLTEKQLFKAGIVIDKNAVYNKQLVVQPGKYVERGFGFENGILYWIRNKKYTGQPDKSKGPLLLQFFNTINYHPKKIIFIDDTKERIDGLAQLLKKQGIEATVLWYHGAKKRHVTTMYEYSGV